MIRPRSACMKIGVLIPTVGTFGAVREIVEVSNVLIGLGHQVYIYHPDGSPCKWLKCLAVCRKIVDLPLDPLDVLIGIVDWQPELYQNLLDAPAKVKAICLLGFEPSEQMARDLTGEQLPADKAHKIIRDAMVRKFLILADSSWQVDWVRKNTGYLAGPAFGGINLRMFHPSLREENKKIKIIYSGDPRDRKGTDTVKEAIEILQENIVRDGLEDIQLEFDSYWGKKFTQEQLVDFYQKGDIFLDGHRRAGWCNPVAEAIACGCVPVCTDIGANRDFSINLQTALVVPVNRPDMMAEEALTLVRQPILRNKLREYGLEKIKEFSYEKVVLSLEKRLKAAVYDQLQ